MATNRQKVTSRVNEYLQKLRAGEKTTVRDVTAHLSRTRAEISDILKGVERYEMAYYRAIMKEIDSKIDEYAARARKVITTGQRDAFGLGENLGPAVLRDVGISLTFGKLSDELITTAVNVTGELITGLSVDMKDDIARALRGGILKGDSVYDVARQIDGIIGTKHTPGYINRSDLIAQQEINKAFSVARQAKDEEVSRKVPGMKKQWWTAQDDRVRPNYRGRIYPSKAQWNHEAAHGQIVAVEAPFIVSGEALMFPRDPNGSLANILGCRCQSVPYMDQWYE